MKVLIRLKPLTPFFFGTDKTFSDDTLHDVVSSYFPQQTHLLGMLRFFLLQSTSLVPLRQRGRWVESARFHEAFSLVGGMDKNDSTQKEESLGVINGISSVFLLSTDTEGQVSDFHFVAPKDAGLKVRKKEADDSSSMTVSGHRTKTYYEIENYNDKTRLVSALTTSAFWQDYLNDTLPSVKLGGSPELEKMSLLPYSDVFKEVTQVGIRRDKKTRTVQSNDEGSFYRKTSYRLAEKFEFAFIADLDHTFKKKEGIVYLGAERSSFRLTVEDLDADKAALYPEAPHKAGKKVLLSDMWLEDLSQVGFMINETYVPHAHMRSAKSKRSRASGKYDKSQQRYFIPRGSVLFDADTLATEPLDTIIGYNSTIEETL